METSGSTNPLRLNFAETGRKQIGECLNMVLNFHQVRVAQVGVEASLAAIDRSASSTYGGIGSPLGYEDLFLLTQNGGVAGDARVTLPWSGKRLHANRFWKKYITGRLSRIPEETWPAAAWTALVPLKVHLTLPSLRLHPQECRAYADAAVWPTGFGLTWNNWIEGPLETEDLLDLLGRLHDGQVDYDSPDRPSRRGGMKTIHHQTLDDLRQHLWGPGPMGWRSDLITVMTIVRASADSRSAEAADHALEALLEGVAKTWGSRPVAAPGDRHAESGQTIYVAKDFRLVWIPDSFLAQDRIHRCGCLHRNVIAATLQVEMLAAIAQLLAERRSRTGSLPAAYAPFVERVLERIDFFMSDRGYSAPFLSAQLERGPVRAARTLLAAA
jgi:hypothetical protein